MFGETTILYVMIWNHPIETTIKNWLFGVPPTFPNDVIDTTLTLWLRPSDEGTDPKLKKLSSFGGLELQLRFSLAKKNLTDMGGSKNSGKHPKSSHGLIIRVFHYFHHPFLGETLSLFLGNTHHGSRGKKKTVGCWVEGVDDVFPGQKPAYFGIHDFWGKIS